MGSNLFKTGKTAYSILDEHGDKSSITIEKWEADLLQESVPDVHKWIQQAYFWACLTSPRLSRVLKGNVVRKRAHIEATKHPRYLKWMADL